MSSRLTYANGAAVLVDWIRECESLTEAKGDEAAIEFLAAWLADGNSMQALCAQYCLNWGVLAAWIRKSPERDGRFRQAMLDRSAFRKERLLDGWWETAAMVPEDAATHGDVHKAREALAKAEGVFAGSAAESGGGWVPTKIEIVLVQAENGRPVRVIEGETVTP